MEEIQEDVERDDYDNIIGDNEVVTLQDGSKCIIDHAIEFEGKYYHEDSDEIIETIDNKWILLDESVNIGGEIYHIEDDRVSYDEINEMYILTSEAVELLYTIKNDNRIYKITHVYHGIYVNVIEEYIFFDNRNEIAEALGYKINDYGDWVEISEITTEEYNRRKEHIISTANMFYGEENIDFNENDLHLTIKFPLINLESYTGKSHTIYDLYYRFYFKKDFKLKSDHIRGYRETFTPIEYLKSYCHSHLSSGGYTSNGGKYCLGTGPLEELKITLSDEYDDDVMTSFILLINEHAKYENNGAYRYIKDLVYGSTNNLHTCYTTPNEIKELGYLIVKHYDLKIIFNKKEKELNTVEFFQPEIEQIVNKYYLNNINKLDLCYKDTSTGHYYVPDNGLIDHKFKSEYLLTFKGKEVYTKLIETTINQEKEYYAKPELIRELFKFLNAELESFSKGGYN